jgi:drug/metabolite transporter (DMT)-like permease
MQTLLLVAGALAIITGIVHSVLGEMLIFRHLRNGGLVPTMSAPPLRERNIRILWATWHLGSVFGWAFAGILIRLAFAPNDASLIAFTLSAIVFANLGGSLLVLIGTKGRHPGWIVLLAVAVFTWLAARAL